MSLTPKMNYSSGLLTEHYTLISQTKTASFLQVEEYYITHVLTGKQDTCSK
jgi:hypothetical protein